jgi:ZIP family zinc transporter
LIARYSLMNPILFGVLLSLFAGFSTIFGSLIAFLIRRPKRCYLCLAMGFSAGVMIFVSFMELLPNAIEGIGYPLALLSFFIGILVIYAVDVLIPHMYRSERHSNKLKTTGILIAIGIAIHNFPEGIAVMFSTLSSIKLGIPIAIAVALHNIPEGIAVSVPIYYATKSRWKGFFYSMLSGIAEPIGALLSVVFLYRFVTPAFLSVVLAGVAGVMIFLSFDELLPEALAYKNRHLIIFGIFMGMLVMAASLLI